MQKNRWLILVLIVVGALVLLWAFRSSDSEVVHSTNEEATAAEEASTDSEHDAALVAPGSDAGAGGDGADISPADASSAAGDPQSTSAASESAIRSDGAVDGVAGPLGSGAASNSGSVVKGAGAAAVGSLSNATRDGANPSANSATAVPTNSPKKTAAAVASKAKAAATTGVKNQKPAPAPVPVPFIPTKRAKKGSTAEGGDGSGYAIPTKARKVNKSAIGDRAAPVRVGGKDELERAKPKAFSGSLEDLLMNGEKKLDRLQD